MNEKDENASEKNSETLFGHYRFTSEFKAFVLQFLFPYGFSYFNKTFTGVSPYIGSMKNVISISFDNELGWDCDFCIILERMDDEANEVDLYGYYTALMKVIAPNLIPLGESFNKLVNVLDFYIQRPLLHPTPVFVVTLENSPINCFIEIDNEYDPI